MTISPGIALAVFLAVLIIERGWELSLASRNAVRVRARGAVESGAAHYPWIVVLHVLWPAGLAAEVLLGHARPPAWWPGALAALAVAQALRLLSIQALGDRWNSRILVVPGEPPVTGGIYRFLAHPNYVGVVIELASGPLMFGAWRTALAASAANAVLLAVRIRAEERALTARS